MKVMPERMRRLEVLLRPYGMRRRVEINPREIVDALYIDPEARNRADANGFPTSSYFIVPELQCNQRPRERGKPGVWVTPLTELSTN